MNKRLFIVIAAFVTLAGSWGIQRQRRALASARAELIDATAGQSHKAVALPLAAPDNESSPSPELLRLRSEVALLRRDLEALPPPSALHEQWNDEWTYVHSGSKPSEQPGFRFFTNAPHAGFATPEAAFQSFQHAMRNQNKEPLTPARMKEIWDVPDDFDDPNAKYSIGMGEGIGSEIGYRIVNQEISNSNEVRLTIEFERPDGGSFRREKILIKRNGRWRMKPASLSRVPDN